MRVNRVRLEVSGEGPQEKLVEHTTLLDIQIVLDLIETPAENNVSSSRDLRGRCLTYLVKFRGW